VLLAASPAAAQDAGRFSVLGVGTAPASTSPISVSGLPARVAGNPVLSINGTVVGSGSLAKADLPAATVYTDQVNTFGAFNQTFGGQILASDGTLALPGYGFSAEGGVGVRRSASNTIQIVTGSAARLTITNTTTTVGGSLSVTSAATVGSTLGVTGVATLTGGFSAGANSAVTGTFGVSSSGTYGTSLGVGTTLNVGGLSTLTGGFSSLSASSVTGNFTVTGAFDTVVGTGGIRAGSGDVLFRNVADSATTAAIGDTAIALNEPTTVNDALTVTGLTTAAKIRTTGVYGVASPFTVFASDGVTSRLEVADGGPVLLTDTGTDSYLRFAATGATSGQRQWRAGAVNGNYTIAAGNDAANTWTTLAQGTSTTGIANGWYWGTAVADVNPLLSYQTKLGTDVFKYLSLSAAELKVGTIVAQDYIATIGGRVLVLPTTQLTQDLGSAVGDTTITVEHNEMSNGDRVLMEADGKVEFLGIASGPTGIGGGDSVDMLGSASANATSITLPTHATGDTIIVIALRIGSNTAPTAPTGGSTFTNLCNGGDNSTSYRVGYLTAAGSAETSGTWANATHMHAFVLTGVTAVTTCTVASGTATTTLTYPAMTLADADGSSYVLRAGITNQATTTNIAMTGYTLQQNQTGASRDSSSWFSNAGQTTVAAENVTLGLSGNTRGIGIEIQGTTTPATGPFTYTVTRDLDGTGRNLWYKGDALANTGQTGDGFWDIYSIQSTKGGAEAGPTMCANERTSATYNAWAPRFCAGNLYGLYGNAASNLYGVAFGNGADVWGQIDTANGFRLFEGGTNQKVRIDPSGYVLLGQSGSGQANTYIDNAQLALRLGTVDRVKLSATGLEIFDATPTRRVLLDASGLLLGTTGAGEENMLISSTAILGRVGTTNWLDITSTVGLTVGEVGASKGNVRIDTSGNLLIRTNTTNRIALEAAGILRLNDTAGTTRLYVDGTDGLVAGLTTSGNGNIWLDTSGNLKLRSGGATRIQLSAANGDVNFFDDDGTNVRLVVGNAGIAGYDGAGKAYLYVDSANGLLLGDWNTSGKPYIQATPAGNLQFCAAGTACTLTFAGASGNITSTGSILLSTGGNVASTGNWSLTSTAGLSFSASSSGSGDATRQVIWAGGSRVFEYANRLDIRGGNNTTSDSPGFTSGTLLSSVQVIGRVHLQGEVLVGTATNGEHAEILPALNAFNPASLGSATYAWKNLYLASPAHSGGVGAPDNGFPVYGTNNLIEKYTGGLDLDMSYDYGIYICTIRIKNGIVTEFLGCV
jgi:hypothetical protein